jgi:hypothetical protein
MHQMHTLNTLDSIPFMKNLAIGLLLALTSLSTPAGAVEPSTDHDVVIVAAGAAGLYAAFTLNNLGYGVLILEASDRHGGRVYSDTLGDVGIEHGAEELYGTTNNFVFNDIKSAQVRIFTETPNDDELYVMDADGLGGGNTCWSESGDCDQDQYIAPGTNTVSLTVTNPSGSHTRVQPKLISVMGGAQHDLY